MSYTRFIASRYLQSRRNAGFFSFIAGIAILGVMLGTATLIIALSVLGGFEREITEKVVGFTSHVQITGFQNLPLRDYRENARLLASSSPVIMSVTPYVAREALIRSKQGVDGIMLKGIDPETEAVAARKYLVAGEFRIDREQGATPGIVLGRKLASRLALEVGDRVVVFGIGRLLQDGQGRAMAFRVTGIYESGMAEYDDVYAYTGIQDAQVLFQIPDAASGFDIQLSRVDSADAVAERAADLLGYPHYARTVFESYRNLFSWIELQKKPIPIILGLIIIVATVNIIGTLLMMVLDKTREVGVLATLGATRWGITRVFLRQGLTIALVGTVLGNLLAFILLTLQQNFKILSLPSDIYFMTSVPVLMRWEDFLVVSAITVALSMLSALIPARLAARLDPVTAIRFS
ncbi:MAG: Lipoprotein-releasing system permease protein [Bacteroidetes bacterium]|nr:Lipoprotein-releasing system permease protein [Bacteroidota bacterium]